MKKVMDAARGKDFAISFFGGIGSGCGHDKNVCFDARPSVKGDK